MSTLRVSGATRTYDNNGNTTLLGPSNNATTFTYDDRNRLREVRVKNKLKASYRYNGLGQRVLKTDAVTPANSRQYVYDSAGHLLGEYTLAGAAVKEYVWLDDTLVAILSNFDGSTYQFVETDHLGTPRAVVHPTENTILWRWDLTPTAFGEHLPNGNPDGDAFTYTLNLRYPGQYFDAESGLHYNYFRDYEPATGRYIESDPIGLAAGLNSYAYVDANPLINADPFGLEKVILFSRSDPLYQRALEYWDDPNVCSVFAHGAPDLVQDGRGAKIRDIKSGGNLEKVLLRAGCLPGQRVILYSCRTGRGENSIAEKLSRTPAFPDVSSPTRQIWYNKKRWFYGSGPDLIYGKFLDKKTRNPGDPGEMRDF